ncbi:MAG: membrane protein insertase YidC, partial [Mariprofundus sp.]
KGWLTHASLLDYRESLDADSEYTAALHMGDGHSVYVNSGVLGRRIAQPFTVSKQDGGSVTLQATLDDGRIWLRSVSLTQGSYVVA